LESGQHLQDQSATGIWADISAMGQEPRVLVSAEVKQITAERLWVLGKVKAISLVEALSQGEASVQELADAIGVSHQNASHHLALLRRAGIVEKRSDGPTSIYAIEDWGAWWVVQQIAGAVAPRS
jgi:DNA-binding transcriptional ArsR family regulator